MKGWNEIQLGVRFALLIAVIYTAWVFTGRYLENRRLRELHDSDQARRDAAFQQTYGGTAVKILQFYARDGSIVTGQTTVLCYGVLNAKAVTIEPAVEGAGVALNRCIEVKPRSSTRYTLTAEGNDGRSVSQSFLLEVRAAR